MRTYIVINLSVICEDISVRINQSLLKPQQAEILKLLFIWET